MKDAETIMEKMSSVSPRMYSLMGEYMMRVPNMLVGIPIARSILACEKLVDPRGAESSSEAFAARKHLLLLLQTPTQIVLLPSFRLSG